MTFLDVLRTRPAPLGRVEKIALIAASVIAAISRVLARGHSMWDWDEALFCLGMRDYDVVLHHPHPPGYPLFIAAGRFVKLFVHSDLLALQIVVMLCGAALLPLIVFFAREARFPFATAFGGGLIFVFLPNVWIFGGSAMSDVPSLALTILACALLLRGCRSSGAYVAGAIVLGLACGIRPQAVIVGAACGVIATIVRWREDKRAVAAAALLGAGVVAASYIGAAAASESPGAYLHVVRAQSRYLRDMDSYHNPLRPSLATLAPLFFVRPVAANAVEIVSILAGLGLIVGIATRRLPTLITLATFLPFAIFALMMLSGAAVSRYAIGYMPMHALLAADALVIVVGRASARLTWLAGLKPGLPVALAAALAWWTWPAAQRVRAADAPPIAAIRWVLHNAYPGAGTLFIHNGFGPFAAYFFRGYNKQFFERVDELPGGGYVEPAFVLVPEAVKANDAQLFMRPHDRLWRIVRQRYFEASVLPAWDLVRFGRGWHDAESDGTNNWRWMMRSSETLLPPAGARGKLTLRFYVPLDTLPPPTIDVQVNGASIDRFVANKPEVEKSWIVPSRAGAANELRITSSEAVVPARTHLGADTRELALKLTWISWQPAAQ